MGLYMTVTIHSSEVFRVFSHALHQQTFTTCSDCLIMSGSDIAQAGFYLRQRQFNADTIFLF